jgi:hypothetical protein
MVLPQIYKPGPGETLDNFVVHLKNRNHRFNVNKRLMAEKEPAGAVGSAGSPTPSATASASGVVAPLSANADTPTSPSAQLAATGSMN